MLLQKQMPNVAIFPTVVCCACSAPLQIDYAEKASPHAQIACAPTGRGH